MGRPFEDELNEIEETGRRFSDVGIESIEAFVHRNLAIPFLAIGSGGSYSVACAFEALISAIGGICKTVTPSELPSERALSKYAVVVFSAGGNNTDILNTYEYIRANEPIDSFVLCFSESSKLAKRCCERGDTGILSIDLKPSRDGFLAVNSIVAALEIFQQLYCRCRPSEDAVKISRCKSHEYNKVSHASYVIALAGAGLMPVVVDFESKCSEAGLVAVQPVSFRNFAHGRHNWVSKHEDNTSIVAFVTPDERAAVSRMLDHLPDIPKLVLSSNRSGYLANMELFPKMFEIVNSIGKARHIDPGRPGVPAYGRKIYASSRSALANDSELRSRTKSIVKRAAWRKVSPCATLGTRRRYEIAGEDFLTQLRTVRFDALALDFDGTIMSKEDAGLAVYQEIVSHLSRLISQGVKVGFATGRGHSILEHINSSFSQVERMSIFVVMHNGLIQAHYEGDEWVELPMLDAFDTSGTIFTDEIHDKLEDIGVNPQWYSISEDGHISIRIPSEKADFSLELYKYLSDFIASHHDSCKVLRSGHSFDIVDNRATKRTVFDVLALHGCRNVLAVGDCGERGGGDFELLHPGIGLSVGTVSASLTSCWNLAPLGLSGPSATLYYLERVSVEDGGVFTVHI